MSHYYTKQGKSSFEMTTLSPDGSSKTRKTNIRDVRALGLLPSVTTRNQIISNSGLEFWKKKQLCNAAYDMLMENPRSIRRLDEDGFRRLLMNKAEDTCNEAAREGTIIHEDIDDFISGRDCSDEWYIEKVSYLIKLLDTSELKSEFVTVNEDPRYAGTVDLMYKSNNGRMGVIDWKTKNTRKGNSIAVYDNYVMQLAAYSVSVFGEDALDDPQLDSFIVYISRTEPGRFEVKKQSGEKLKKAYDAFKAVCKVWDYINKI